MSFYNVGNAHHTLNPTTYRAMQFHSKSQFDDNDENKKYNRICIDGIVYTLRKFSKEIQF